MVQASNSACSQLIGMNAKLYVLSNKADVYLDDKLNYSKEKSESISNKKIIKITLSFLNQALDTPSDDLRKNCILLNQNIQKFVEKHNEVRELDCTKTLLNYLNTINTCETIASASAKIYGAKITAMIKPFDIDVIVKKEPSSLTPTENKFLISFLNVSFFELKVFSCFSELYFLWNAIKIRKQELMDNGVGFMTYLPQEFTPDFPVILPSKDIEDDEYGLALSLLKTLGELDTAKCTISMERVKGYIHELFSHIEGHSSNRELFGIYATGFYYHEAAERHRDSLDPKNFVQSYRS